MDNWGELLIHKFLFPFALFATPSFLLLLMAVFVARAFGDDLYSGVRSFAAVLLPLMVMTFLLVFRKEMVKNVERLPPWIAFLGSITLGLGVMALLSTSSSIPATEMVLSGSFSILLMSYVAIGQERRIVYFFGMVLGLLDYIVVFGFPPVS